jgi:hypothetical protein
MDAKSTSGNGYACAARKPTAILLDLVAPAWTLVQ